MIYSLINYISNYFFNDINNYNYNNNTNLNIHSNFKGNTFKKPNAYKNINTSQFIKN